MFHMPTSELTSSLVAFIGAQCATQTVNHDQMHQVKLTIKKKNSEQQPLAADSDYAQLSPSPQ